MITFIVTVVLARYLRPADFGLMTIIVALSAVSSIFTDAGFTQALIQADAVNKKQQSTVFLINTFIGILLYVALYVLSPFLCTTFDAGEQILLMRLAFLAVLFDALGVLPCAMLQKTLEFKQYSIAQMIGTGIASVCAVFIAICGGDCYALVANFTLYSVLRTLFFWFFYANFPGIHFSFRGIKKLFYFSSYMMAYNVFDRLMTTLEAAFIGKMFSKSALGFYSKTKELSAVPTQELCQVIMKVIFPFVVSDKNNNLVLQRRYRFFTSVIFYLISCFAVCIFLSAEEIVIIVLGEQWKESAIFLRCWCIYGFFFPLETIGINILMVIGRVKLILLLQVIRWFFRILGFLLVYIVAKSVLGSILAIITVSSVFCVIFIYYGGRQIGYVLKEIIDDTWYIIFICLVSGGLAIAGNMILYTSSHWGNAIIKTLIFGTSFLMLSYLFKEKIPEEFFLFLTSLRKKILSF